MKDVYLIDVLGVYCGMHYYDIAFAEILRKRNFNVKIYSNFVVEKSDNHFFPIFFQHNKVIGLLLFLISYIKFFVFVLKNRNVRMIYLAYGEIYELPFIILMSLAKNGFIDVHEVYALKYSDTSFVAKVFGFVYRYFVKVVICHSENIKNILSEKNVDFLYVPHFKYIFQKMYKEEYISSEVTSLFNSSKTKFLFFGNLSLVKGIDVVLDSFIRLMKKTNDFELVIAGKNVDNINFSKYKNISSSIIILDRHINDDELVYLYSKTDYILLPYKKTSQSGIFAMAAYFRKPMILSNILYFRKMLEKYPSFGVMSTLEKYHEVIFRAINFSKSVFYLEEDCFRFENVEENNKFINELLKYGDK